MYEVRTPETPNPKPTPTPQSYPQFPRPPTEPTHTHHEHTHQIVASPRVLARATAELQGLDLRNPEHRTPAGMAARLPYLCVKETLRLYPALSFTTRRAGRDTALGGYFVPEGSVVAASVTNLHRDPAVWGPDAGEFRCVDFHGCWFG